MPLRKTSMRRVLTLTLSLVLFTSFGTLFIFVVYPDVELPTLPYQHKGTAQAQVTTRFPRSSPHTLVLSALPNVATNVNALYGSLGSSQARHRFAYTWLGDTCGVGFGTKSFKKALDHHGGVAQGSIQARNEARGCGSYNGKRNPDVLFWSSKGRVTEQPRGWPALRCVPDIVQPKAIVGGPAAYVIFPAFGNKAALTKNLKRILGSDAGHLQPATYNLADPAECKHFFSTATGTGWVLKASNMHKGAGVIRVRNFNEDLLKPFGSCSTATSAKAALSPALAFKLGWGKKAWKERATTANADTVTLVQAVVSPHISDSHGHMYDLRVHLLMRMPSSTQPAAAYYLRRSTIKRVCTERYSLRESPVLSTRQHATLCNLHANIHAGSDKKRRQLCRNHSCAHGGVKPAIHQQVNEKLAVLVGAMVAEYNRNSSAGRWPRLRNNWLIVGVDFLVEDKTFRPYLTEVNDCAGTGMNEIDGVTSAYSSMLEMILASEDVLVLHGLRPADFGLEILRLAD